MRLAKSALVFVLALLVCGPRLVQACPFCSAVAQTFTEEISSSDVAIVARLLKIPVPPEAVGNESELPRAVFEIVNALSGKEHLKNVKTIETIYFGKAKPGSLFMVIGVDPPALRWSTPLQLTRAGRQYLQDVVSLPSDYKSSDDAYAERLRFFLNYLEHADEMLARDAYDEFARAPYSSVILLKKDLDHAKLIEWITDRSISPSRRRLYFTLIGVAGGQGDIQLLERLLNSEDRKDRAGLDALIGCYITLKGKKALPLIEDLFLKNENAEYADTYGAIMALRFHGTEGGVVSREDVLVSLRCMLDRPKVADLIIPDLARWEDWDAMPRLVQLFKDADDKSSWVRVPVINYLRACPKPEAEKYIAELEKLDPVAVKRARTYFAPPKPSQ
ncbi:MAG: hypothetical protein ABGX22_22360 [Pirellulaceae bacterium]